jgi:hypothetical protein
MEVNFMDISKKIRTGYIGGSHESYLEMSQIGWFNTKHKNDFSSKNTIVIWINEEGNRPIKHFHFHRGKDRIFGGCIMIEKSMYFQHDNHLDTLTDKEIIYMVNFFNSLDPDGSGLTIWKMILMGWNFNNPNFKIKLDTIMPDYKDGILEYKKYRVG